MKPPVPKTLVEKTKMNGEYMALETWVRPDEQFAIFIFMRCETGRPSQISCGKESEHQSSELRKAAHCDQSCIGL